MNETWDTFDIAEYLGVTRAHVTDKLTKQDDFPAPVINRSRRNRRWSRVSVECWAAGVQSREAISSELAL